MFKLPKDDSKYHWTEHIKRKMIFYGLSADRIKRVLRNPKRSERGIVENTIAVMQPRKITLRLRSKPAIRNEEIWVMYQKRGNKKIVITAWRYPGKSPIRDQIPIPGDILEELKSKDGI